MIYKPYIECMYIYYSVVILFIYIFDFISNYMVSMYILMFTYIWIFGLTLNYRNFSLYQIFLINYFVFLLSRIFLTCLGKFDFTYFNLYQFIIIDDKIANAMLIQLTIFLISTSYAWLVVQYTSKRPRYYISKKAYCPSGLYKILESLYYIFIIFSFAKVLYRIYFVMNYGYISIFNGTLSTEEPLFFKGVFAITELLLISLLYYNRKLTSFKKYTLLFISLAIARIFTGQRGYTLVMCLYFMYMWSTYYKEIKIFSKISVAFACLLPICIQWINVFRTAFASPSIDYLFASNVYLRMLVSQGISLEVIGDVILYKDALLNKVPFLFGYIVDLFQREPRGQVIEDILYGNYLGDHLTYILNSNLFFMGRGTGTSIVAEIYELCGGNLILILFVAFLITYVVLFLANKAYCCLVLYGVSFYVLRNYIYSPRDSVLKHLDNIIFVIIGCFFISLLCFCIKKSTTKFY